VSGVWDADDLDDDSAGTVFRDVLLLALIGFVAMVIMMLPHLARKEQNTEEQKSPGNVVVEMHWPDHLDADVDLWVQAPNDIPVGFYNQGSRFFNLLRDDLGAEGDVTGKNYEISYSRGIPEGEYIVNVHMYGPLPSGTVVPVEVVVSVKRRFDSLQPIVRTEVLLVRRNQEETATRFRLTADGKLVEGSVNNIRRRLVTAG
jgi:hypothetical protein